MKSITEPKSRKKFVRTVLGTTPRRIENTINTFVAENDVLIVSIDIKQLSNDEFLAIVLYDRNKRV